jgi:dihydrofolate reductase
MEGYSEEGISPRVGLELSLRLWIRFDVHIDGKYRDPFSGKKAEATSRELMYLKSMVMGRETWQEMRD